MDLDTLKSAEKLCYQTPRFTQLGPIQAFVLGGADPGTDGGDPDFSLS